MFLRFEGTSQKGAIASPYAHAGLAAGEAESARIVGGHVDILLVFITFREHVQKTQKPLRGLRLVAFTGSEKRSSQELSHKSTSGNALDAPT